MLDAVVMIESIGAGGQRLELTADDAARRSIAERFDWIEVGRLVARLDVREVAADTYDVTGRIEAALVQKCRSTGNPVPENLDVEIHERFMRMGDDDATNAAEIDPGAVSVEIITGDTIPVGEMVAQLAGINAAVWPRDAAADLAENAETPANSPFASLAEWKKKN